MRIPLTNSATTTRRWRLCADLLHEAIEIRPNFRREPRSNPSCLAYARCICQGVFRRLFFLQARIIGRDRLSKSLGGFNKLADQSSDVRICKADRFTRVGDKLVALQSAQDYQPSIAFFHEFILICALTKNFVAAFSSECDDCRRSPSGAISIDLVKTVERHVPVAHVTCMYFGILAQCVTFTPNEERSHVGTE
jgi:hypothetical protein